METATEEKEVPTEAPKKMPCIYGEEIRRVCNVRTEIAKRGRTGIDKYLKPIKPLFGEMEDIIRTFTETMNSDLKALSDFCMCCPYAEIHVNKNPSSLPLPPG